MTAGTRRGGRRGPVGGAGRKPIDVVVDADAVYAALTEGPMHKVIEGALASPGTAFIDAVSLLEVMVALSERGLSPREVQEVVDALALRVEDVDKDLAGRAVEVASEEGAPGLSSAQLFCVALARKRGLPILTNDARLSELVDTGVVERL